MAELIFKYFPQLSQIQRDQFSELKGIYEGWNKKVNVISRRDFENFYERHVLHSLAIAKFYTLEPNTDILDFGTGGGFPGIPLAILFPEVSFLLVDSIEKKIKVVQSTIDRLSIKNTRALVSRVEILNNKFDTVVGRAVKNIPQVMTWTGPLLKEKSNCSHHGIIYLKGGEFRNELDSLGVKYELHHISKVFSESFFESKKIVRLY